MTKKKTIPDSSAKNKDEECSHECSGCASAANCSDVKAGLPPKATIDVNMLSWSCPARGESGNPLSR